MAGADSGLGKWQGLRLVADPFRGLVRRILGRDKAKPLPPKVCGCRADANGVPYGKGFEDIVVMPGLADDNDINLIHGGPNWPDNAPPWVYHRRKNKVLDLRRSPPEAPTLVLDGPCVWAGMIHFHFGHICAEFITRILWSLQRWPDAIYLFIVKETEDLENVPGYFWQILSHLGLAREQVQFVREPVMVRRLRVMPQAEQVRLLRKTPPSYLAALQPVTDRYLARAERSDVLYVSRLGMLAEKSGAHAGESYLVALLEQLGVATLDPTKESLERQLSRYAGARTLIFSEGSAIHGRQLLGRIDQDCIVLNRRPKQRKTGFMLTDRVRSLRYAEVCAQFIAPLNVQGRSLDHRGISFYDLPILFQTFAALGVDLAARWDHAAYLAHMRQDTEVWTKLALTSVPNLDASKSLTQIAQVFDAVGLSDLVEKIGNPLLGPRALKVGGAA